MISAKNLNVSLLIAGLSTLLVSLSPAAQADVVQTRIFRIEAPASVGQETQILSTNDGRVYFVPQTEGALLGKLKDLNAQGVPARLVLDGDRVIDAQPLSGAEAIEYSDSFDQPRVVQEANDAFEAVSPEQQDSSGAGSALKMPASFVAARAQGYEPTILNQLADVQSLFRTERELNHHSQCYERAEIWTREFQQARGISSMKVFMFFTERFRQRYTHNILFVTRPYKWWFHVAPFVYLGNQEYVLDREFLNQAVPMDDWTFKFIGQVDHDNKNVSNPSRGEAACLDAGAYTQYSADANPARYCVLRKVPMYYFQPVDVQASDCQAGSTSTSCNRTVVAHWRDSELKRAYKDTTK